MGVINWDEAVKCAQEESLLLTKSGAEKYHELQEELRKKYKDATDLIAKKDALEKIFPGVTRQ